MAHSHRTWSVAKYVVLRGHRRWCTDGVLVGGLVSPRHETPRIASPYGKSRGNQALIDLFTIVHANMSRYLCFQYLTGMIIEVLCCALGWPNTFGPISGKHSINRKWHVHMIWVNEVANGSPGATAYSFTSRLTGSRWDFNPFSITTCHLSAKTILFWPLLPRTLSVSHEIKCVWIAFNGRIKPTVYFFFLLNLRRPSFWPQFEKKYQISTLSCVQVLCEN